MIEVWVDLDTIMKNWNRVLPVILSVPFSMTLRWMILLLIGTDKDELKRIQEKFTDCNLFRQPVSEISYTAFSFLLRELLILMPYSQLQQTLDLHYMLQEFSSSF